MEDSTTSTGRKIELEPKSIEHLSIIRKWTSFFSIMGFVFLGLMFVIFLFMAFFMSGYPLPAFSKLSIIPAIIFIAIYVFPIFYLYKFSSISKKALSDLNNEQLTESFKFLKMHFNFMGILSVIVLSIYVLVLLVFFIAGGVAGIF